MSIQIISRGPRKASTLFDQLTKKIFLTHGFANLKILNDWNQIVGENLAKITTPQKIQFPFNDTVHGTLVISVVNPGFALSIQAQESSIIQKLAVYFGYKAISKLKIVITKTASPTKEKNIAHKIPKEQITAAELQDIHSQIDKIEDQELKAQFQRLAASLF